MRRSRERGGVTPFNVLPLPNTNSTDSGGTCSHGAATPYPLMRVVGALPEQTGRTIA